ncbi:MAG: class I tRNA ligase family protein [Patescibacteria group bacterium]
MKYTPQDIEPKWQGIWESTGINTAQDSDTREKYYVLDMFPYPSASGLHVGHWRGYVLSDVAARIKKAQGYNVLHPMGWDAFGLPAENYALQKGVHPRIATNENIAGIKQQLKQMGTCFDWSREIDTTDPEYYKFTQWIFLKMFEKGLAYREDKEINWCPKDKTGLANEEVVDGQCDRCGTVVEKKRVPQWILKITAYADRLLNDLDDLEWPEKVKAMQRNWIGKSEGTKIDFTIQFDTPGAKEGRIPVFTTRADTLYGCTYIVLAPEHPWVTLAIDDNHNVLSNKQEVINYVKATQAKTNVDRLEETKEKTGVQLLGINAVNPINNEKIPVLVADYVLGDYGTGAVMAVPAHDERDWEFAKKYDLPIIETVVPNRIDTKNPPVEGKKTVERQTVQAIVRNPKDNTYLILKWTKQPWTTFPMGGVEEGEDVIEAARREVLEETGYSNLKFIKTLGGQIRAEYFAAHKDQNRVAYTTGVMFELINEEKVQVSTEEEEAYTIHWVTKDKISYPAIVHAELADWLTRWDKKNLSYCEDGILINSGEFSGLTSNDARKKIAEKLVSLGSGELTTNFKLRDWVFSRQRYWGEPIPLIYCENCKEKPHNEGEKLNPGWFAIPESELPLQLPQVEKYEPTGTGESPLAGIPEFMHTTCPRCEGKAVRETNTMPQWAGSCWYYLAYAMKDKENTSASLLQKHYQEAFKQWMPVDLYVGGVEHAVLHLLYARFWFKFLYDLGVVAQPEPFMHLFNQGMVNLNGAKMSKSKGNVVSPDEMVAQYGTDSLRAYELFIAPPEQDAEWNSQGLSGVSRFLNKVWDLAQSTISNGITYAPEQLLEISVEIPETVLQVKTHQTIKKFNEAVTDFRYNTLVSTLMEFTNFLSDNKETLKSYPHPLAVLIQLLSPICPHIAEELWHQLGFKESLFSGVYNWPVHNDKFLMADTITITIQENGKLRGTIEIPTDCDEDMALSALRETKYASLFTDAKKTIYVKNKIINIVR